MAKKDDKSSKIQIKKVDMEEKAEQVAKAAYRDDEDDNQADDEAANAALIAKRKASQTKAPKMINKSNERVFAATRKFVTDVFKLMPASVIKNEGLMEHTPESDPQSFVKYEHCHPFRTVDSNGLKHAKCVPIAGHYHVLEMQEDPKGGAPIIIGMSGPMKQAYKKRNGKKVLVDVPVNDYDFHIHDMLYLKSEEILARTNNAKAAEVAAAIANKESGGMTASEQRALSGAGARPAGQ